MGKITALGWILCLLSGVVQASILIPVQWVGGVHAGKSAGKVQADDTPYGLLLTPHLKGLSPGTHGFHIHATALCSEGGMAAGGHLDPLHTGVHHGPYRASGHLGDLPVLIVNENGDATLPVLAPRLNLAAIRGHALIVHAGSDNYSKNALKQPGSAVRVACGVIP